MFVSSTGHSTRIAAPGGTTMLSDDAFAWVASSVAAARAVIGHLVPIDAPIAPASPEAARIAWAPARQVLALWSALEQRLQQACADQHQILTDGAIIEDERLRRLAALADRVDSDVAETVTTMRTTIDELDTALEKLTTPPRPTPPDHLEEAALERRAKLILDALDDPGTATARIVTACADAIAEGDPTAIWWWASGPWLPAYLESRGWGLASMALDEAVATVLDRSGIAGIAAAREIRRVLGGYDGLRAALFAAEQLADQFLAPARSAAAR